ncbi:MAG: energy-coupling factor transporter transmembrane protein EcfT [Nitrospinales bacterium]|jgi:energy-coupling factor transporter transmembrane protein EcfT
MSKKLFSPIAGGFVPGSTYIHRMRADYKICGTLVFLGLSGMSDGALLAVLTLLGFGLAWTANISGREIYLTLRKLTWFFIAVIIFPLLFTPGYFVDLPAWIPFNISVEGLVLAIESCSRLVIVVLFSTVLIKTTSDFLTGLDSLIFFKGKLGRKLKEILQIAVMSIEVLPLIFKEAERQLAELKSMEKTSLVQTIRKAVQQVVPFIVSVFSNIPDYIHQRDAGLK